MYALGKTYQLYFVTFLLTGQNYQDGTYLVLDVKEKTAPTAS